MDQPTIDFQQNNILLEMMKQHISNGLPFHYETNYKDSIVQQNSDGEASINIEHEQDENEQMPMPVFYKKRARIKFTQEQLDLLETTFEQHRYPTIDMIDDLVEQLNLPTQKITVWFQNRRARLKKSQQKLDDNPDDHQQYDSGIHLDDDVSRASSTSPPSNIFPPISYHPPPPPSSSPYYLPNSHQSFYNPMWQNFRYPFPSAIPPASNFSYDFANYHPPFVFQDMSNYQQ